MRVICDARKADVVITVRGMPTAFLCPLAEYEVEGAFLMQSRSTRRRMKRALAQIQSRRGVSPGTLMDQFATCAPRDPVDVSGAAAEAQTPWRAHGRRSSRPIAGGRRRQSAL